MEVNTDVRQVYFDWLMVPPKQRRPKTKSAMAEKLGVARSTLYMWERDPEFQQRLRLARFEFGVNNYGLVINTLLDIVGSPGEASQNRINAAKTLIDSLDLRAVKDDGSGRTKADFSSDELKRLKEILLKSDG